MTLQRLQLSHSSLVAFGAAEICGQEGLDQFPGERSTETYWGLLG
jgi:hypothetical protein